MRWLPVEKLSNMCLPLPERASVWWASGGKPASRSSGPVQDPLRPDPCGTHRSPHCVQPFKEVRLKKKEPNLRQLFSTWTLTLPTLTRYRLAHAPVVVHHHDGQTDLFDVLWGYVEDDGLIVGRIERALLGSRLSFLQSPSGADEVNFNIRIWKTRSRSFASNRYDKNMMYGRVSVFNTYLFRLLKSKRSSTHGSLV